MPEPIQSSVGPNQSYYDPSEQVSRAPDASAAPPPPSAPPAAASAAPTGGTKALLAKHQAENCDKYLISAGVSVAVAGAGAAAACLSAPTVIPAAAAAFNTAANIVKASIELTSYFNCEDKNAAALKGQ